MAALMETNREWILQARASPDDFDPGCFQCRECPLPASPQDGEVTIHPHLISIDATMRNAMTGVEAADRTSGSAYWQFMTNIWQVGEPMAWDSLAQVVESKVEGLEKGDFVRGFVPLRELTTMPAGNLTKVPTGVPPAAIMSCLGTTGQIAFTGAKFVCNPQEGDVGFVSGAAGATGMVAVQTMKNLGCKRVIGSAGTDEKCKFLESLGAEAFNYKKESPLEALKRLCPDGINCMFDNVGGEALEAAIECMNDGGRICLCGAISQYNTRPEAKYGIKNLFQVVAKFLTLQGVLPWKFSEAQNKEAEETLAAWLQEGKLQDTASYVDGFDNFPQGLVSMYSGGNTGKQLVRIPLLDVSRM